MLVRIEEATAEHDQLQQFCKDAVQEANDDIFTMQRDTDAQIPENESLRTRCHWVVPTLF